MLFTYVVYVLFKSRGIRHVVYVLLLTSRVLRYVDRVTWFMFCGLRFGYFFCILPSETNVICGE